MTRVRFKNITKIFTGRREKVKAVDDVTLTIESGQFYTLLGPSGCGTTTVLRMMAGFEDPTDGKIFVLMHNLPDLFLVRIELWVPQ